MNKYIHVKIYDMDGELSTGYIEPLRLSALKSVLEDEDFETMEEGQSVVIDVVEMSEDEAATARESLGY